MLEQQQTIPLLKDEMLLGQELKFKNKLCNLKLGTFFSAFTGLGTFGRQPVLEPHAKLRVNIG